MTHWMELLFRFLRGGGAPQNPLTSDYPIYCAEILPPIFTQLLMWWRMFCWHASAYRPFHIERRARYNTCGI